MEIREREIRLSFALLFVRLFCSNFAVVFLQFLFSCSISPEIVGKNVQMEILETRSQMERTFILY